MCVLKTISKNDATPKMKFHTKQGIFNAGAKCPRLLGG